MVNVNLPGSQSFRILLQGICFYRKLNHVGSGNAAALRGSDDHAGSLICGEGGKNDVPGFHYSYTMSLLP